MQDSQWQTQEITKLPDGRPIKQVSEDLFEVTLYKGEPATKQQILNDTARLKKAFPQIEDATMAILIERMASAEWTQRHVQDAINHVIDNCEYPTFTIARIMNFDKKKRLYNYSGYCNLISEHKAVHEDFGTIKIDGRPYWYLIHENI